MHYDLHLNPAIRAALDVSLFFGGNQDLADKIKSSSKSRVDAYDLIQIEKELAVLRRDIKTALKGVRRDIGKWKFVYGLDYIGMARVALSDAAESYWNGKTPPKEMMLEGLLHDVSDWEDILSIISKLAVETNRVPVPFEMSSKHMLLNHTPAHQDGTTFKRKLKVGDVWLNLSMREKESLRQARNIAESAGMLDKPCWLAFNDADE